MPLRKDFCGRDVFGKLPGKILGHGVLFIFHKHQEIPVVPVDMKIIECGSLELPHENFGGKFFGRPSRMVNIPDTDRGAPGKNRQKEGECDTAEGLQLELFEFARESR